MSSSSTKVCFNSNCKDVLERSRKGWRRRTGEFADLCDRCANAYEEGKFCETFHLNASGWRCCESCGKQIHCGCIVSFHMFVLLDAGGIECITCARKSFILTPNPAWPPPSLFLPVVPERIKDLSVKNWSSIAGSGPVPWRQAPSLFNASNPQSELHTRMPFEVEMPGGMDRFLANERLSTPSLDKKRKEDSSERLMNGGLKIGPSEILENGTTGVHSMEQSNPCVNVPQQQSFLKNESSANHFSLSVTASKSETNDQTKVSGVHAQRPTTPSLAVGKQFGSHNGIDSSGETQLRNVRPRGDVRGRSQLLPRYWPKITDQELQQISGDSNSVITPLFEKMLSASDAGRIGRLVLPKKCAEAYFPPISQPEGLPLVVQDLKGKEWVFQFRFWPNNNSRMYVLEGVTPCIQSMQLQAGDVVTFSRLEPEGKLVMGFRKSSIVPTDQGNETICSGNGVTTNGDGGGRSIKPGEIISTHRLAKGNSLSTSYVPLKVADPSNTMWPEVDKSGYIAKEGHGPKPVFRKRKTNTLVSKSKRVRIENEMIELKVTWEQAQGLLRPPPNYVPSVVVIEGFEFEEYEQYVACELPGKNRYVELDCGDAPIIGRPTILATDHADQKIQWAQCEDCFKWRKVPDSALFPSRWTCSDNLWDPERSVCSVAQELTTAQLEDLLPKNNEATLNKLKATKEEPDSLEALEGLDTLANLAIQEEGDSAFTSSSQATTRHPRHRPGCTCIVCIQPPSGKGPKHKQTCTCNVCLTVKRRFRTLMLRREMKQSEKDAETAAARQKADDDILLLCNDTENTSPTHNKTKSSTSPFKGQIDLNIQPEREEELSPVSDSGGIMRLLAESSERYLKQQKLSSSSENRNSTGSPMPLDGAAGANFPNGSVSVDKARNQGVDLDYPVTSSSMDVIASSTAPER